MQVVRSEARWRWKGVWGVLLLLVCLTGAHTAWRAIADHRNDTAAAPAPLGTDIEDHFPGAALAYASEPSSTGNNHLEQAAPAPGSTGTVAPPPEPLGAARSFDTDNGVVAARPFAVGRATSLDRGRALECLTAAIYYEAGNQTDDGERAVAQVILNRVRHPAFPPTVCGVVYQGSEHAGCQFSFACDGSMTRPASRSGWARALRVASDALAGQVFAPVGLATHYHTYAVTPAWNRALVMTDAVGAHFFHRWKGYWGTSAAFRRPWTGHEPLPGPHVREDDSAVGSPALILPPLPAATGPSIPIVSAPLPTQPAHADTGTPRSAAPAPSPTLPASSVLDRWKDSGTPLR